MRRGRAYEEASKLGEKYPIRYSESNRRVIVERFMFPDGWDPRVSQLRYELPSTYPRDMPDVFIPSDVDYEGGRTEHRLTFSSPPNDSNNAWDKWCIEDQNVGWDATTDTLMKLTTLMQASLAAPNSDNPIRELDR